MTADQNLGHRLHAVGRRLRTIGGAVLVIVAVAAIWIYIDAGRESTDDAQVDGHITQIAGRIGGTVEAVNVTDNQQVEAGAVLVQLDRPTYQAIVDRATAELADAEAAARAAQAGVPIVSTTSTSGVTTAEAGVGEARAAVQAAMTETDAARARLAAAQAVCQIRLTEPGMHLSWASFGDSFLLLLRNGQLKQLNTLYPRWLGYLSRLSERPDSRALLVRFLANEARYVGVARGLETGLETLQPGDLIFLCTDGLIGSDRQPNPALLYGLGKLLESNLPLVSQIDKAIASALSRGELKTTSPVLQLVYPEM